MLRPFPRLSSNQELPDYRVLNRLFEIVERLDNLRAIAPMFLQDSPTGKGIGVALPPSPPELELGAVYGTIPECANSVVVQTTTPGGLVQNVTLDLRWPTAHPVANKNFSVGDRLAFIRYQAGGATGLAIMPDIDGVVGRDGGDVITQRMDEFNILETHGKDYAGASRNDFTVSANPAESCSNLTQYMIEWNGYDAERANQNSWVSGGGSGSSGIDQQVLNTRRMQFYNQVATAGVPDDWSVYFAIRQIDTGDNKYAVQVQASTQPPNCIPSGGTATNFPSSDPRACTASTDTGWTARGGSTGTLLSDLRVSRITACGTPPVTLTVFVRTYTYDACGKLISVSGEAAVDTSAFGTLVPPGGPSGSFTSADGHTITFTNGIITSFA